MENLLKKNRLQLVPALVAQDPDKDYLDLDDQEPDHEDDFPAGGLDDDDDDELIFDDEDSDDGDCDEDEEEGHEEDHHQAQGPEGQGRQVIRQVV